MANITNTSAATAIMGYLQTGCTGVPIAWVNDNFQIPNNSPWIRPTIKIPSTEVAELGNNGMGLRNGLLMIQIFDKSGNRTKTANGLADKLETLFRRKDVGNIWFDEPTSNPIGNDPNGYYQIMFTCDFHYWVNET